MTELKGLQGILADRHAITAKPRESGTDKVDDGSICRVTELLSYSRIDYLPWNNTGLDKDP